MTRVFWHALVFGLAPILQKLVSLVLLPLYTHYLSATDYGEIEILTIITGLFGVVLRLELRHGYMRAWIAAADDASRAGLFRAALGLLATLGAPGAAVFLVACGPLCDAFLGHRIGWAFRAVLALGLFADVTALVCNATMQARLQSGLMVSLGVAQFAVSAGLTVLCVVGFHMGAIGFFIGGTASSLLGLAAMLALLGGLLRGRAGGTPPDMRAILGYSMPLLGGALLFFVVRNADRIAVSQFVSVAGLGIYAMAWTLANILMTVVFAPIQTSFDVWRYEMHQQGGGTGEVAAFFRIAMLAIGVGAVGLDTFGADTFVFFADSRFAAAVAYLPLLSAAVLLQAGYAFLSAAFYVTGATGRWLRIFAAGAALQVVLSLV
ncbi:MAG: oligosaccharide flippase family protein, partial [Pseudomonadota bacterium]|nr:oligosaccharide flippase family protein [Pseudomonadota bacterium]